MAAVLCVGNLQCDVLCRSLTELPVRGELRMIESIDVALSGNGGSVAAALGRLGLSVDLAAYSGADLVGEQFRALLAEIGVGVGALRRHPALGTGTSVIALAPDGERSVLFVNGANDAFDLDGVPDAWLDGVRVVSLSSVFVLPQFTGGAIGRLFARARSRGARTVLNTSWDREGRGLPFLAPALAETDYLVLSLDEGRQLTGRAEPDAIVRRLEQEVRGTIVLTLGADGALVRGERGQQDLRWVPAVSVTATDCTGAGDAFVAGLVAGLVEGRVVEGHVVEECARLGCLVASFAVTGPGAYPRIPRLAEIEQLPTGMS